MNAWWQDQISYRKKEICLYWVFVIFATILTLWIATATILSHFFMTVNQPLIIMCTLTVLFLIKFISLMSQIYKYHRFEYNRIIKESVVFLVCSLISISFIILNYFFIIMRIFNPVLHSVSIDLFCSPGYDKPFALLFVLFLYSDILMLNDVLLCFAIIKVKSSDDMIQGISKLDYLLKVSVFQIYKDPNLRLKKYQINRMTSKLRDSSLYEG